MSEDETAAIVKCSEYMVKAKSKFSILKDDTFTKAAQLPKCLSKTIQFFHRGKSRSNISKICTNTRTLHSENA